MTLIPRYTLGILLGLLFVGPMPAQSPSFVHDVVPILTRLGCNQGACHGKAAGRNGFRLSLRGYAPELDYLTLTRETLARRIDTAEPARSLLLLKALGQAPHEGGKLLELSSPHYQVLRAWIEAGAPGPLAKEPELRALAVTPKQGLFQPGQKVSLRVEAEYTDGRKREVTHLARFDSNDAGIAEVDATGSVRVVRPGETAIRASFLTEVAVALITVPHPRSIPASAYADRANPIDDHVLARLLALHLEPSPLAEDAMFMRRVYLDALGTLPTPEEVRAFLADSHPERRTRLVEAVLKRPEFVDYWALQWGDLLQNRKERDHDVRGTKGVRAFHHWIRDQVAANRPWDQLVRDVLTAQGSTDDKPQVGYFVVTVGEQREAHRSEVVASAAQAFLGVRIGCAQCHNHPLERYTQDDYYRFSGFFSRIKLDRKDPKQGPTTLTVSAPDANANRNPVGVVQPRTGQFLEPRPLDRKPVSLAPGEDPRTVLAAWMTQSNKEAFAGAMVNRIWRHYLGVGLVEPVDDLRASNPPTNPDLWRALCKNFVDHSFGLRQLMRTILTSCTYQRTSATRPGNEGDARFASHYLARRLPAEVLLDAISQATGVPDLFPGYPQGTRAVQVPDPGVRSYFLSLFGRSERVTACACERNGEVTLPQLLHLRNGEGILQKIRSPDGRLARLLSSKLSDAAITEELFLATLSRFPSPAERSAVEKALHGEDRAEVFRDLFWALLNSKEFSFNH